MAHSSSPLVVGIGGTIGSVSSTERALRTAMTAAADEGFRTHVFGGEDLARLPLYNPRAGDRTEAERVFVDTVRQASAIIIASPGYHGSISGLVKNALENFAKAQSQPGPDLSGALEFGKAGRLV